MSHAGVVAVVVEAVVLAHLGGGQLGHHVLRELAPGTPVLGDGDTGGYLGVQVIVWAAAAHAVPGAAHHVAGIDVGVGVLAGERAHAALVAGDLVHVFSLCVGGEHLAVRVDRPAESVHARGQVLLPQLALLVRVVLGVQREGAAPAIDHLVRRGGRVAGVVHEVTAHLELLADLHHLHVRGPVRRAHALIGGGPPLRPALHAVAFLVGHGPGVRAAVERGHGLGAGDARGRGPPELVFPVLAAVQRGTAGAGLADDLGRRVGVLDRLREFVDLGGQGAALGVDAQGAADTVPQASLVLPEGHTGL